MLLYIARRLLHTVPILFVTGGSMVVQMAACNTVLQTLVEDDKRGRTMAIFSMCFMGITPFGSTTDCCPDAGSAMLTGEAPG